MRSSRAHANRNLKARLPEDSALFLQLATATQRSQTSGNLELRYQRQSGCILAQPVWQTIWLSGLPLPAESSLRQSLAGERVKLNALRCTPLRSAAHCGLSSFDGGSYCMFACRGSDALRDDEAELSTDAPHMSTGSGLIS